MSYFFFKNIAKTSLTFKDFWIMDRAIFKQKHYSPSHFNRKTWLIPAKWTETRDWHCDPGDWTRRCLDENVTLSHGPCQRETRRPSLALATANEIDRILFPFWKTGQGLGTWRRTCVATLPEEAGRGQRAGRSSGALCAQRQRGVRALSDVCWCRGTGSKREGAQAEPWQSLWFL